MGRQTLWIFVCSNGKISATYNHCVFLERRLLLCLDNATEKMHSTSNDERLTSKWSRQARSTQKFEISCCKNLCRLFTRNQWRFEGKVFVSIRIVLNLIIKRTLKSPTIYSSTTILKMAVLYPKVSEWSLAIGDRLDEWKSTLEEHQYMPPLLLSS